MQTRGLTNGDCAHLWAQRTAASGQTSNGNLFFEGDTIYSYGYHFPIASYYTRKNKTVVLYNSNSYSVSTSQHQGLVRYSIDDSQYQIIKGGTEFLRQLIGSVTDSRAKEIVKNQLDSLLDDINESSLKHKRARVERSKNWHLRNIYESINQARALCELFGVRKPQWINNDIDLDSMADMVDQAKKKEAARIKKQNKEKIQKWLAGEHVRLPYDIDILMRVAGDNIETSRQARFPVEHGVRAWEMVKACRDNKKEFVTNGKTIHLGHYRIDKIDSAGNVKAGCHFVKFDAIKHVAKQLELI